MALKTDVKRYYLYRLKLEETPAETSILPVNYFPPDCPVRTGDVIIVFQSQTLAIFGEYVYEDESLIITRELSGNMRDYFGKLSFVSVVSETSARTLKKRAREITKADYDILSKLT
jgi:hypothetical protein